MAVKWQCSKKNGGRGYFLGNDGVSLLNVSQGKFHTYSRFCKNEFYELLGSFCMLMELQTFLIGNFFLNSCRFNVISVFITRSRMLGRQTDFRINFATFKKADDTVVEFNQPVWLGESR